jgi:rfaE bifunctional protein nucleotidyltransferase chain/domain
MIIKPDQTKAFEKQIVELKTNKSIGMCHGVFDLLHPGHIEHLKEAKLNCDVLIVSLTADRFANKGPGRPIYNENLRLEMLDQLKIVDFVILSTEKTALTNIRAVKPNLYFKGIEYKDESLDITNEISNERHAVEEVGGKIFFTDKLVMSSTKLINNFYSSVDEEMEKQLEALREKFSLEDIYSTLDEISSLKVLLVGEIIEDSYVTCKTLGKSSKEPILCVHPTHTEKQIGGVYAAARHLRALGAEVSVVSAYPDSNREKLRDKIGFDTGIRIISESCERSIEKIRYIDEQTKNKMIEIYSNENLFLTKQNKTSLQTMFMENVNKNNLILVTDFGHGLIDDYFAKIISDNSPKLAVNCQMNAGNQGLNSFLKYPKIDFLSMNTRELDMEKRGVNRSNEEFLDEIIKQKKSTSVYLTEGSKGGRIYTNSGNIVSFPAFSNFALDRVGAGDAVFVVSSVLSYLNADPLLTNFISNLTGNWVITYLGNQKSIDLVSLKKTVKSLILK